MAGDVTTISGDADGGDGGEATADGGDAIAGNISAQGVLNLAFVTGTGDVAIIQVNVADLTQGGNTANGGDALADGGDGGAADSGNTQIGNANAEHDGDGDNVIIIEGNVVAVSGIADGGDGGPGVATGGTAVAANLGAQGGLNLTFVDTSRRRADHRHQRGRVAAGRQHDQRWRRGRHRRRRRSGEQREHAGRWAGDDPDHQHPAQADHRDPGQAERREPAPRPRPRPRPWPRPWPRWPDGGSPGADAASGDASAGSAPGGDASAGQPAAGHASRRSSHRRARCRRQTRRRLRTCTRASCRSPASRSACWVCWAPSWRPVAARCAVGPASRTRQAITQDRSGRPLGAPIVVGAACAPRGAVSGSRRARGPAGRRSTPGRRCCAARRLRAGRSCCAARPRARRAAAADYLVALGSQIAVGVGVAVVRDDLVDVQRVLRRREVGGGARRSGDVQLLAGLRADPGVGVRLDVDVAAIGVDEVEVEVAGLRAGKIGGRRIGAGEPLAARAGDAGGSGGSGRALVARRALGALGARDRWRGSPR